MVIDRIKSFLNYDQNMNKPNFKNLENTLLCRKREKIPLIELHINHEFKQKYYNKKDLTLKDDINLSLELGYDFVLISKGILKPAQSIGKTTEKDGKLWASEKDSIINSLKDIDNYNWQDPEKEDFSEFEDLKYLLPQGMKIIATCGKIFTASWMLFGFDNFCFLLYENYELVRKLFEKVGQLQFETFKKITDHRNIGAIAAVDDIAYSEGLMLSADFLRENLFPWYKKMGQICNKKNIPFIYHSDGNITEIIDDLIDCGFNAVHPIEPKALNIGELLSRYKDKLCFLGNIEMDTLIQGRKEKIKELVLNNLKTFAKEGFYCCGSSNTITEAMPVANVVELCKTVRRYGTYPIKF